MTKLSAICLKLLHLVMLVSILIFTQPAISIAESSESLTENKIKAGLIFNFINFTRWPETSFATTETPYRICIADKKSYPEIFNIITTQSIHDRKIEIQQIDHSISAEAIKDCKVVFILFKNSQEKTEILNIVSNLPILTIAETSDKADSAAMINLIQEDQMIGFTINRAQAKMSGIEFSSKMLRLAINVIGDN